MHVQTCKRTSLPRLVIPVERVRVGTRWGPIRVSSVTTTPKIISSSTGHRGSRVLRYLKLGDGLHAVFVLSTIANGTIKEIDPSEALSKKGAVAFLSADTIAADGYCNLVIDYELVFASKRVHYYGQAVGLIVAKTKSIADAASKLVHVIYTDVVKPILTIEDAIKSNSFFDNRALEFQRGNVASSFRSDEVIVEGEVSIGHQYHFHLETQRSLCIPGEEGCMTVYSSTQNPSQVQQCVAVALNRPQHKVNVNVARVGGAYGAKLNRTPPVAMACAMAADKLQKPVRLLFDLNTNMQLVGGRSPYLCRC
ncbi:hypothetical protein SUGI_0285660 [Cryptomeria japonica]|nr:hypothetical protein SUGI_0285660 [Cryptomeria japonica]